MNYPKLNVKELSNVLNIVEAAIDDDAYLDPSNCPYDEGTINIIKKIIGETHEAGVDKPYAKKRGRPTKAPTIPMDEVEREVDEIRKELADLKVEGQAMETSDRIQIIKTRAALIERVIGMKERVGGLKQYHSFIQTVIGIMQDHIDPKERELVLQELKPYAEQ